MKSFTFLSAALAATALPLPALAQEATLTHDHIRTELHGDSGPVAVLIPGMSTPGEVWDDTVAAMAGDTRLLVVTVRGFDGERGTANEQEGAIDGIVSDIATDLEARGLGEATIVGHSLGGLLALQFGLDHPELAKNLLVIDALPFFGTVFDANATLESIEPQAAGMRDMMIAGAEMMRAMGEKNTDSGQGAMGMSVDEARRVTIANWSLDAEPFAVAQLVYEDTMTDLREEIAALKMPVTVLHFATGEHADMAIDRYATDYAALEGVRMVPVDNSAHFVQLDQPEIFRAELSALLSR